MKNVEDDNNKKNDNNFSVPDVPLSDSVLINNDLDTITIFGIKYSSAFFKEFAWNLPIGGKFTLLKRENNIICLEQQHTELHRKYKQNEQPVHDVKKLIDLTKFSDDGNSVNILGIDYSRMFFEQMGKNKEFTEACAEIEKDKKVSPWKLISAVMEKTPFIKLIYAKYHPDTLITLQRLEVIINADKLLEIIKREEKNELFNRHIGS